MIGRDLTVACEFGGLLKPNYIQLVPKSKMDNTSRKMQLTPFDFTEDEAFGEWMHGKLKAKWGFETARAKTRRVRAAMSRLQPICGSSQRWNACVVRMKEANAFIAPGRYLYISSDLLHRLPSEGAVALVLGHELGHARLGHLDFFHVRTLWKTRPGGESLGTLLYLMQRLAFSPERERDADAFGLDLCVEAGYDGVKCLAALDVLKTYLMEHDAEEMVYGPEEARTIPTELAERWKAKAKVWTWERLHGYPSLVTRWSLLEDRLEEHQMGLPPARIDARNRDRRTPLDSAFQARLAAIDRALADLHCDLTAAAASFVALARMPAYLRLAAALDQTPQTLTGRTRAEAARIVSSMRKSGYALKQLLELLDRAEEALQINASYGAADATVQELEVVLFGDSIPVQIANISFIERNLCSEQEQIVRTSPHQLLAQLNTEYENVRQVICEADAAWTRWAPIIEGSTTGLAALEQTAQLLRMDFTEEFSKLHSGLVTLQELVESDPLSVPNNADRSLTSSMEDLRIRLLALMQERSNIGMGMQRAASLLDTLKRDSGSALDTQLGDEMEGEARPRVRAERLADLTEWLAVLQGSWNAGQWQAVRIGLDRWLTAARSIAESG